MAPAPRRTWSSDGTLVVTAEAVFARVMRNNKVFICHLINLGLIPELLSAVETQGYEKSTPVQELAIPAILSGRDVQAKAQTGTGKTAAFTLPMLQLLNQHKSQKRVIRALVLLPTRELAAQVEDCVQKYGVNLSLKAISILAVYPSIHSSRH